MKLCRFYASHRRAWTPRLWPILIADAAIVLPIALWLQAGPIASGALGVGVAAATSSARWAIWRRRHPVITHAEFLDLRRRAAPWN